MTGYARLGLVLAFAGLGGTAATVPALLPLLETRLDSNMQFVAPLLFAGLFAGVLLSTPILTRLRVGTVVIAGAALQSGALLWLTATTSLAAVLIVAVCAGVGFGLAEAAGSVAAKRWTSGSVTRTLAMLTAIVAVAAALSPIAIAILPAGPWLVPVVIAALHLLACGALARAAPSRAPDRVGTTAATFGEESGPEPMAGSSDKRSEGLSAPRWPGSARRVVILAGLTLALYVGVESIFSGWSALIPAAVLSIDAPSAALGTSAFWLCVAVGRIAASLLLRRGAPPRALLVVCLLVAAGALVAASFLAPSPVSLVGAAVAVIAIAPVYSLVLGEALDQLASSIAARVTGPLVACGALGGVIIPMALSAAGQEPGGIATFLVGGMICAVLGVTAIVVWRSAGQSVSRSRSSASP